MSEPKPTLSDLRIERDAPPAASSWRWGAAGVLLALLLAGGVVFWLQRPAARPVRTAVARAAADDGVERTVLNASGYVTARRQATVSAKLTAKVIEVLVEEGMKVREGQVLARLDDTNVRTSLHLAEAQLAAATNALAETRVRIKEAAQELQRQTDLIKNQIATQANYDHAEAAHLALQARLEQQQAEIAVAAKQVAYWQQQLDDTVIRAPFSGIVTSKNAQPGEMISPISAGGGFTRTGICTIVDMESLEIEIDVNESYINRVHPGQAVEAALDAYRDWKIPSKVIAIIPTADRQKSTVKVRVGMDQLDPRILPEMSVKVAFREVGGTGPLAGRTVTIPQAAVRQQDGRSVVWVVSAGRAERRAVTVSNTHQGETVVSAGLSAGERVIVEGPPDLKEGLAVAEKEAARQ
ncbi:MAG TPA: efflux RND transporter periplasmic adaptor subunit [Verrucomicrobiota bacterium]|jgi:RND family efflux transporter MFP subunit|nr:efflux RND transporter periplasmic adaptor subunit [Verrucomicrobiota bacterium]OQC25958.1 MAG: Multidrug resistance protein MdtA precursor [Verrucomicrobia bacterium ADurb.Bin063]HRR63741.1 efflux RND transporter periplasmic adaptor subunit [Candidatus Paceibacterota bacterium]MBP8015291.1 efflux RND transporter periplasmic adaptor subunit [Verrucomicrobiota bacterium]MDI9372439.1 efflux RND transporter periplasmic adaptor subunit [Verrucomicrobiota bacterium]